MEQLFVAGRAFADQAAHHHEMLLSHREKRNIRIIEAAQQGLTRYRIAKVVGVDIGTITKVLEKAAAEQGCTLDELVGRKAKSDDAG